MIYTVLAGIIAAFFIPILIKLPKKLFGLVAAVPLGIFIYYITYYSAVTSGQVIKQTYQWFPAMGINLSFYLDGLSLIFAMIISFVGAVVFFYASAYMKGNKYIVRFFVTIMIFMSAMIGLVTSDNMITMFVFWELTSITSYILIGFHHEKEKSRYAALQALLITGGGGILLLAGIILLANISGTWGISSLAKLNPKIISANLYPLATILILIGAFTKSAQFPFHFWLPNAMEAPTPVSGYLHSATMVKTGIYLVARFNPALGGTGLWHNTIIFVGAVTMVFTVVLALKEKDLKGLLAYSTLSVLGTLLLLIGIGSHLAIKAFIIYLIAHALYKGTLFLVSGSISHETGTRDVTKLSGLKSMMPITTTVAVLASLSKMGIVPLIGFLGKETVYAATLEYTKFGYLFIALSIFANAFIVYITITVGFKPFFTTHKITHKTAHEAPFEMWIGPLILALVGLVLGIFPTLVINDLINYSELGVITEQLNIPVKMWHGFTLELGLSILTVSLGLILYKFKDKLISIFTKISFVKFLKPSYYYQVLLDGLLTLAEKQTKLIQNGYLRYYIITIVLTTVGLAGYSLLKFNSFAEIKINFSPSLYEIIIGLIIISATIAAVKSKSRLGAVVGLGVVGYSVALIFIIYGAPDLAMTQFAIETLTVILFVLVIYKLPRYLAFSSPLRRIRDLIIAGSAGTLMALILLFVLSHPLVSELKNYFAKNSLLLGKGKNIVNVILVDFRALDTLGEITVLAVAALGVFALLKLKKNKEAE